MIRSLTEVSSMSSNRLSPLWGLPVEVIDQVIFFITNTPEYDQGAKRNLLSLSRADRLGSRLMTLAEKALSRELYIRGFEKLKLIAKVLKPGDRRLNYIKEVEFLDFGVEGRIELLLNDLESLHSFFSSLKQLNHLSLYVQNFTWQRIKMELHYLSNLSTLNLTVRSSTDRASNHNDDDLVSIADIPSLLNLTEITFSHLAQPRSQLELLSTFLGPVRRPKLLSLDVDYGSYPDVYPLFHLFPNLNELQVGSCSTEGQDDDPNLLSSIPSSLRVLSRVHSPNIAEQFRRIKNGNQPFHLTHFTLPCTEDFDYSIISAIPTSIEELTLEWVYTNLLVEAIAQMGMKDITFKRLKVSPFSEDAEEVEAIHWNNLLQECTRLGIELERN